MQFMGLAGSIGGWTLFILTIKKVGFHRLIEILTLVGSTLLFWWINGYLMEWIR